MRVYDEDAFFGSGEYEVRTVAEVREYLTEEEESIFNKIVDRAERRRHKAESKSKMFSRGYKEARKKTNSYRGESYRHSYRSYGSRHHYCEMSEVEEAYNDCIQFDYLGG